MSTVRREFATSGPVDLVAELDEGTLDIATEPADGFTVTVHGPRSEEFTITQRGREIVVRSPRGRSWLRGEEHQVEIRVPEGSDLTARTGSASLHARGRYAAVSVKAGSGAVLLDDAGDVAIASGSGLVRCGELSGAVRIKSGSGDVAVVAATSDGTISTGSGSVRIGTVTRVQAVKTGSGDVQVGRLVGDLRVATGSGGVSVERMDRGGVGVRTASGDVRVGIPAGMPTWTDIATVTGRVDSRLPPVGEPGPGREHVSVRVQSVSGDVLLLALEPTEDAAEEPQDA